MVDTLFDDVNELLAADFGDDRILRQIHRACKNGEVISNYERKYVRDLAARYLKGDENVSNNDPNNSLVGGSSIVPDVVLPDDVLSAVAAVAAIPQTVASSSPSNHVVPQTTQQIVQTPRLSTPRSTKKNTKIILGICGAVALLVVLVSGFMYMNGDVAVVDPVGGQEPVVPPINPVSDLLDGQFQVQTDLSDYASKDLISISGWSEPLGDVILSIQNEQDQIIWKETVSIRDDGVYSTMTIAGGSPGWDAPGIYTIIADTGDAIASETFLFDGK